MKPRLKEALKNMQRHNAGVMSRECFGFEPGEVYDALVVAPGWKPDKTILDPSFTVTQLTQHAYFSGFLVEKEGVKIAWAQTASGACNVLDHVLVCAELQFKKFLFAGAVGGLVPGFPVGTISTPAVCYEGSYAGAYFKEKLPAFTPFSPVYPPDQAYVDRVVDLGRRLGHEIKRAKVFCTDSIALEYSHLDEIRSTGAELIDRPRDRQLLHSRGAAGGVGQLRHRFPPAGSGGAQHGLPPSPRLGHPGPHLSHREGRRMICC